MTRLSIFALASLSAVALIVVGVTTAPQRMSSAVVKPEGRVTEAATDVPPQHKDFIQVGGRDLRSKLEEAVKRGRSASPPKQFWAAYSFDVRDGVSVDVWLNPGQGPRQIFSAGPNVALDPDYVTRNLGVFLLYDPSADAPTRVEVYNLETREEFGGHPVYWMGRVESRESMQLLQSFTHLDDEAQVAAPSAVIIALHNDQSAGGILEEVIRRSSSAKVRSQAVLWLAQTPGNLQFLAAIARDRQESLELRKQAIYAMGVSKGPAAVSSLQQLYDSTDERAIKKQIIFAANGPDEQKVRFLKRIAEGDPDPAARKEALFWLSNQTGRLKQ